MRMAYRDEVSRLTAERDRARDIAVALEGQVAAVRALAEEWCCNCGGPSPEGLHEMHCDSHYGQQLRSAIRGDK